MEADRLAGGPSSEKPSRDYQDIAEKLSKNIPLSPKEMELKRSSSKEIYSHDPFCELDGYIREKFSVPDEPISPEEFKFLLDGLQLRLTNSRTLYMMARSNEMLEEAMMFQKVQTVLDGKCQQENGADTV